MNVMHKMKKQVDFPRIFADNSVWNNFFFFFTVTCNCSAVCLPFLNFSIYVKLIFFPIANRHTSFTAAFSPNNSDYYFFQSCGLVVTRPYPDVIGHITFLATSAFLDE